MQKQAIIKKIGRPALETSNDEFELPADYKMKICMMEKNDSLKSVIASVGRINIVSNKTKKFGTGTQNLIFPRLKILIFFFKHRFSCF